MRTGKRAIRALGGLLALVAGLTPAAAANRQEEPGKQPAEQAPVIRTEVSLVNLFATVRDKNKRIIPDLTQKDFHVFEDNQEQKIAFFSREVNLPITLGLLIDTSLSEERRLPIEEEASSAFFHRVLRKGDEAMIINFDLDAGLLTDFTDDLSTLDSAIRKAQIRAVQEDVATPSTFPTGSNTPSTVFYDAVYLACNDKLSQEAGRKAIVVITDAMDEGSERTLEDAIEAAQRTDTVVHILLVYDPGYGNRSDVAKRMAEETGGRIINVGSGKHLDEAFDQISEELRSQYVLGYYPANTSHDGRFRKIRVAVDRKDAKILTRKGYYAPTN